MPQAGIESPAYAAGCGVPEVSCETLAEDPPASKPADDPDFPPESLFVPIDDEIYWVDVSAVYYDRDDSTKGNTNPKSQHSHGGPAAVSTKPRSNSLRFSGNLQPKVPIIGLPNAVQHSGYLSRSARFPTSARIFPKKPTDAADRGRKSAVPDYEPSSPKVSCIGKVLSQRERERRRRLRHEESPEFKKSEPESAAKVGCWASIAGAFRCHRSDVGGERAGDQVAEEGSASSDSPPSKAIAKTGNMPQPPSSPEKLEAATEAPSLGALKRFASGRKSDTWEELALGGDGSTA